MFFTDGLNISSAVHQKSNSSLNSSLNLVALVYTLEYFFPSLSSIITFNSTPAADIKLNIQQNSESYLAAPADHHKYQ